MWGSLAVMSVQNNSEGRTEMEGGSCVVTRECRHRGDGSDMAVSPGQVLGLCEPLFPPL